ncbi:hypothetical protein BGW80DRAFT_1377408 [Lactifluus volemus]|nr:hypothetical protein BGW80DRAFT_1377408 [Lactifluus volemus]
MRTWVLLWCVRIVNNVMTAPPPSEVSRDLCCLPSRMRRSTGKVAQEGGPRRRRGSTSSRPTYLSNSAMMCTTNKQNDVF